jgi:undecaprenyl-diphosphatase
LPRQRWLRWFLVIGLGWLATVGFLLLLIGVMRTLLAAGVITTAIESRWLQQIIALSPIRFADAVWLSAPGDITIIVPIVVAVAILLTRAGHPIPALTVFLSYFLVSAVVLVGWLIWDRPRPDLIAGGIAAPAFHSFPSGHMAQSVTVYGLFCYLWLRHSHRRSEWRVGLLLLLLWLGNLALTRLVLGTHWPSDVVAGTVLGAFWLAVLILAIRQGES